MNVLESNFGQIEMVWTCAKEGSKYISRRLPKMEQPGRRLRKRVTKEDIPSCVEREHADSSCERGRHRAQEEVMEKYLGKANKRKKRHGW